MWRLVKLLHNYKNIWKILRKSFKLSEWQGLGWVKIALFLLDQLNIFLQVRKRGGAYERSDRERKGSVQREMLTMLWFSLCDKSFVSSREYSEKTRGINHPILSVLWDEHRWSCRNIWKSKVKTAWPGKSKHEMNYSSLPLLLTFPNFQIFCNYPHYMFFSPNFLLFYCFYLKFLYNIYLSWFHSFSSSQILHPPKSVVFFLSLSRNKSKQNWKIPNKTKNPIHT